MGGPAPSVGAGAGAGAGALVPTQSHAATNNPILEQFKTTCERIFELLKTMDETGINFKDLNHIEFNLQTTYKNTDVLRFKSELQRVDLSLPNAEIASNVKKQIDAIKLAEANKQIEKERQDKLEADFWAKQPEILTKMPEFFRDFWNRFNGHMGHRFWLVSSKEDAALLYKKNKNDMFFWPGQPGQDVREFGHFSLSFGGENGQYRGNPDANSLFYEINKYKLPQSRRVVSSGGYLPGSGNSRYASRA